jgi:sugar lactone lactonase YvrE
LVGGDDELSTFERIAEFTNDPHDRTNDGGCDPFGGFVIGSMAYDERPGGGAVNNYDAAGRLVETIIVPGATQTSSGAFGGDNRDLLYITTSRQGLPDSHEPSAGAVFAVQTGSRGAVASEFAG